MPSSLASLLEEDSVRLRDLAGLPKFCQIFVGTMRESSSFSFLSLLLPKDYQWNADRENIVLARICDPTQAFCLLSVLFVSRPAK